MPKRVEITATERVTYSKIVELNGEQLDELKEAIKRGDRGQAEHDLFYIDPRTDVVSSDGLEDIEYRILKGN